MRSLIVFVVLGVGGWSPPAAPGCTMRAPAGAPAVAAASGLADGARGTPSGHRHGEPSVPEHGDGHRDAGHAPDAGCSPTMACGAGMAVAPSPPTGAPALVQRATFSIVRLAFASTAPTQDPPPPRLPV